MFTLQTEALEMQQEGRPRCLEGVFARVPRGSRCLPCTPELEKLQSSSQDAGRCVLCGGGGMRLTPHTLLGGSLCGLSLRELAFSPLSALPQCACEQKCRAGQLPAPYPALPPRPPLPIPGAVSPNLTHCPHSAPTTPFRPSSLHQDALMPSPVLKPAGEAREPGSCPWERQKL